METQVSVSQSLFQVYYLGSTEVDRRCSAAVLPWIIEEMKLKLDTAQDMKLVWITLGELGRYWCHNLCVYVCVCVRGSSLHNMYSHLMNII